MNQPPNFSSRLYFGGLLFLAASLPLSVYTMSLAQFVLLASWLISGKVFGKIKCFFNNRTALVLSGLFLLHIVGMIYTTNVDFGLKDLRVKIPLLLLPLIISTSPRLSRKEVLILFWVFVSAVTMSGLISTSILTGIIPRDVTNIRDISPFISHIRLALLVCVAIVVLSWLSIQYWKRKNNLYLLISGSLILWNIAFLILLESLTGILALLVLIISYGSYLVWSADSAFYRITFIITLLLIALASVLSVTKLYHETNLPVEHLPFSLDSHSESGNVYDHNYWDRTVENGHRLWIYISWQELESSWNERSNFSFNGLDKRGQEIRFTIIRFLTSKGLRKDAKGVASLSSGEITAIERGVANVNHQNISDIGARIRQVLWEYSNYKNGGNPSGHSVIQRIEFWKASLGIIGSNPWFGVGTGDANEAFKNEYLNMMTQLSLQWRLRSHNQFLAIGVAFGFTGLLYFIFSLWYPIRKSKSSFTFVYYGFFMVALLSMLMEDTLETQAGVTFFAFFNSLLLLGVETDTSGG